MVAGRELGADEIEPQRDLAERDDDAVVLTMPVLVFAAEQSRQNTRPR